jgi:hypothetical protein
MVRPINFSAIKQAVTNNAHSAAGWLGKHKVTVAGTALTVATVAAVIATSILTCGTTAIICGAVLGGVALTTGLGTIVKGVKDLRDDRKKLEAAAKQHNSFRARTVRAIKGTPGKVVGGTVALVGAGLLARRFFF